MERSRKGQSGAAVLVVLIALLIVLYVLFLPPAERAILLGEDSPTTGPVQNVSERHMLLSTVPSVTEQRLPEEHQLPVFTVRTQTGGNVLAERNAVQARRTAFHNEPARMTFTVPEHAQNVLLSFNVQRAEGDVEISLNGETIFDQELFARSTPPIILPSRLLGEDNELVFSSGGVGFALWDSNHFSLGNVRVTADVTSFDQAAQTQRFVVRDLDEIETAQLVFIPECFEGQGRINVALNSQTIFSGVPSCGIPIPVDIALSRLQEGENVLSWQVESGQYIVDQSVVVLERTQSDATERFSLASELLGRIVAQDKDVYLEFTFAAPGAQGVVAVNGEELAFRTHKREFAASITPYLRGGSNTIELVDTTTDVTALKVFYD